VFAASEFEPTATLLPPEVFTNNAFLPIAVKSLAVVIAAKAP